MIEEWLHGKVVTDLVLHHNNGHLQELILSQLKVQVHGVRQIVISPNKYEVLND
jgi:hypothetical protein